MNKIHKFAFNNAQAEIIKDNVDRLIKQANICPERAIEILLGMDIAITELPKKVKTSKGVVYTLKDCNYLNDSVRYDFIRKDSTFFKTEEDAELYRTTGEKKNSHWYKTGDYTIEVVKDVPDVSSVSFETWLSFEVVSE
jgi:hypothetical protein